MKFLFISINMPHIGSLPSGGIYYDLVTEIAKEHSITVLAPALSDGFIGIRDEQNIRVVRVNSKPIQGNIPLFKKGIRLLSLNHKFTKAYTQFLDSENFDIVMMPTPPMNFVDVASYIKKRSGAKLYLILRDIHPECLQRREIPEYALNRSDVDIESQKKYSVNPLIYTFLRRKAQRLYKISDIIGCMSPGNAEYIKTIAPHIDPSKLKILPNWYSGDEISHNFSNDDIKDKYKLHNKFIAIFGGTIGPAQAVWNIAALAKNNLSKKDVVFLVIGRGSKLNTLKKIAHDNNLTNIRFIDYLPKDDYEKILKIADVGLISIDEKYTVPTCPSKIIGYMALAKPVLAIVNNGNDYGEYYIDNAKCGFWCDNLNYEKYFNDFNKLYADKPLREQLGLNGYNFYKHNLTVGNITNLIYSHIEK